MRDMQPEEVVGTYREHTLMYFGGIRRRVLVTDAEADFPEGWVGVSHTDAAGVITHVNPPFADMAGYAIDEMLGESHCLLRHPDMPSAVFRSLWDALARGRKWQGYVKNLRKDGRLYWAKTTVIPNLRDGKVSGYTAIQCKPSRLKVAECISSYPKLF